MKYKMNIFNLAILGAFVFVVSGCEKEPSVSTTKIETNVPKIVSINEFRPSLPDSLASLTIKDGGACYLDAVNFAPLGEKPVDLKSGGLVALGGWAVADLKAAKLPTALAVQLNGKQPYFASAEAYSRPGLGKALGNDSLDAGGLKIESIALNIPYGQYRVLFLMQSGSDLLRCDTGRTVNIE